MRKNVLSTGAAPGERGLLFSLIRSVFPASRAVLPPVAAGLFF